MGSDIDDEDNKGIIPRIVEQMFASIMASPGNIEYTVRVSYMEIYMERIRDLLVPQNDNLPVHEEKSRGVYVKGLLEIYVSSVQEVYEVMRRAGKDVDATIVYGVNHNVLKSSDTVISNASCTTNCLAPLVKPLHDALGLESGLMTTVHAYTNDQVLTDVYHDDLRRARSATMSMIPAKTGAAAAVGLVLPELNGKLDGFAIRVPTINVSLVDLSFVASRETSVDEVNSILKAASEGPLKGILDYNTEPLVSVDFNHNPASSTYDSTLTKVSGKLVKVSSWYDNEWGFSNRMLDTTVALMSAK